MTTLTLDELLASSPLSDAEARARVHAAKARKTGKVPVTGGKTAEALSPLLGPPPPQTDERPIALVLYWTRTRCSCSHEYTAPTFGGNSTFVRWATYRLAFGYKRVRPHRIPHGSHRHTPFTGDADHSLLPTEISWTEQTCSTCPECHGRGRSLPLPLGFAPENPIKTKAERAFYAGLLAPKNASTASREAPPSSATLTSTSIREDIAGTAADIRAFVDAVSSLDLKPLLIRYNHTPEGHPGLRPTEHS